MRGNYIIWNTLTGIYDGAYTHLSDAMDVYKRMSREEPRGKWIVVQLTYAPIGMGLADEMFHANQGLDIL